MRWRVEEVEVEEEGGGGGRSGKEGGGGRGGGRWMRGEEDTEPVAKKNELESLPRFLQGRFAWLYCCHLSRFSCLPPRLVRVG